MPTDRRPLSADGTPSATDLTSRPGWSGTGPARIGSTPAGFGDSDEENHRRSAGRRIPHVGESTDPVDGVGCVHRSHVCAVLEQRPPGSVGVGDVGGLEFLPLIRVGFPVHAYRKTGCAGRSVSMRSTRSRGLRSPRERSRPWPALARNRAGRISSQATTGEPIIRSAAPRTRESAASSTNPRTEASTLLTENEARPGDLSGCRDSCEAAHM